MQSGVDPKKAAVAAAIARAKAKKQASQITANSISEPDTTIQNTEKSAVQSDIDPKKAAVAAAIARAKAKQLAKKQIEVTNK
ncbi:hypothetical protein HNR69_001871 [Histophilus somni]|nr:hypothetical protein [Histophilus somni]